MCLLLVLSGTAGGALLGLIALSQAIFAVIYIKSLAATGWALGAVALWVAYSAIVVTTGVSGAELAGNVVGSLVWGGFPIVYLWRTDAFRY